MLKETVEKVCSENEASASVFKSFNRVVSGRPRKEVDQPDLLSTIVNIVEASSAADNRRRSEHLRSVTTLDDLHQELKRWIQFK